MSFVADGVDIVSVNADSLLVSDFTESALSPHPVIDTIIIKTINNAINLFLFTTFASLQYKIDR